MNQILKSSNNNVYNSLIDKQKPEETDSSSLSLPSKSNRSRNLSSWVLFLKVYFAISIFVLLFSLGSYVNRLYVINKNEKISQQLLKNYNVSMLYSNPSSSSPATTLDNSNSFSVIGSLEIKKINLKYPILSGINDSLLQIAPCKFYGPMANEVR